MPHAKYDKVIQQEITMPRNSQPVTITLGNSLKAFVDSQVATGNYASASEVVRAGLRALEIQEAHLNDWMREKVCEAMDDPRPSIPADEVVREPKAYMDAAVKAEGGNN